MKKQPPSITKLKSRKVIAFGWYGGKFSHLDWILPLLPECHHYCEPYAGSGSVLLNREPSHIETYNDLDGEVANFFRVLRDEEQELQRLLALTPFSREEFFISLNIDPSLSPIERARRFYVRARQVRTGLAQTASLGRWANCRDASRIGPGGNISRWLGGIDCLPKIAERLLRVQIENRPAIDCIKTYDSSKTLFYIDPPYVHESRKDTKAYLYEMSNEDHTELAEVLNAVCGKVAVSNYESDFVNDLYPPSRWFKTVAPPKTILSTKGKRIEVLWTNYNPNDCR